MVRLPRWDSGRRIGGGLKVGFHHGAEHQKEVSRTHLYERHGSDGKLVLEVYI